MPTTIKITKIAPGVHEFRFNGCLWYLQYIGKRWEVSSGKINFGSFDTKKEAVEFVCGKQKG